MSTTQNHDAARNHNTNNTNNTNNSTPSDILFVNGAPAADASVPLRAAYERVRPRYLHLAEHELLPVNVDVPTATNVALRAMPGIRALREDIVRDLATFDLESFDALPDYILALAHAHALFIAASTPPPSLIALHTEASAAREELRHAAGPLARRGLMAPSALEAIDEGSGYKDTAMDLIGLVSLYRANWAQIGPRTVVTAEELARAEGLGNRIVVALAERDHSAALRTAASIERQQAFTLFMRTWQQARRAAEYVRFGKEDAATVVPAMYNKGLFPRAKGRETTVEETTEPEAPKSPKAPVAPATPARGDADDTDDRVPQRDPFAPR